MVNRSNVISCALQNLSASLINTSTSPYKSPISFMDYDEHIENVWTSMMIYRRTTTALPSKKLLSVSIAAFASPPILATTERSLKGSLATAITVIAATNLLNIALRLIPKSNSKAVAIEIRSQLNKRRSWRSLSLQKEDALLDWTLCATKNGSRCVKRRKFVAFAQQRDTRRTTVPSSGEIMAMETPKINLAPC